MQFRLGIYVLLFAPVGALQLPLDLMQWRRTPPKVNPAVVRSAVDKPTRRSFLWFAIAGISTAVAPLTFSPSPALAIPMVSTEEFSSIIRDSARSIETVEFSGPKSETVVVVLVDGTNFGINDVIESPTDPRSPLKIAAMCKANQIPYRFLNIESLLNATPRKKKMYTNARVLEAAEKQKEKELRMQQDEALRQEALREMQ